MILSLIYIILSIFIGFITLDYLRVENNFIKRCSFSIPIGFIITGWTVFIVSLFIGQLCEKSIAISEFLLLLFVLLFYRQKLTKLKFRINFTKKELFPLFIFILLSLYFLFGFRYDSNGNLLCYNGFCSDGPWHISIINSFVNSTLMPDFPLFYNSRMVYPFMIDFVTSILVVDNIDIFTAIKIIDIFLIFSLCFSLFYFLYKITNSKFISNVSMSIFLFFKPTVENYIFMKLFPHIILSKNDILYFQFFNFTEVINNIFHPQRSYLLGFPIVMIFLYFLLDIIERYDYRTRDIVFLGIIVGLLPFFHAHSFIAINVFALILSFINFRAYVIYLATVLLTSFPQILCILLQPKPEGFFEIILNADFWNITKYGFLVDRISFWSLCFGLILITGTLGFIISKNKKLNIIASASFILFILVNFVKLQPSFGDSNKLTIFFLLSLSIYSSIFIYRIINRKSRFLTVISFILIICLISGFSVVLYHDWYKIRTTKYEIEHYNEDYPILFHKCDFIISNKIMQKTKREDVILSYYDNSFVSPLYLSERQIFFDNKLYLESIGLLRRDLKSPKEISKIVDHIYETGDVDLLKKENITCVFIGPRECLAYGENIYNFSTNPHFNDVLNLKCGGETFQLFCYDERRD